MYSTKTEATFMAKVTRIAISVEANATNEMVNGPMSLQKRSIRRIRAFITRLVSRCHCFHVALLTSSDPLISFRYDNSLL
jgi:hypothetical protein